VDCQGAARKGADAVGLDFSGRIEDGRERISQIRGGKPSPFRARDAHALPFADDYFD